MLAVVTQKEIHGWVRGWGLIAFSVPSAVGVGGMLSAGALLVEGVHETSRLYSPAEWRET